MNHKKPKPSPSNAGHSTVAVSLPPGWESFEITPQGHPGKPWLSAREFAEHTKQPYARASRQLREAVTRGLAVRCERMVASKLTHFYKPV